MRNKIKFLAATAVIAGLVYLIRPAQESQIKSAELDHTKSAASRETLGSEPGVSSPAPSSLAATGSRVLTSREFTDRFSLSAIDFFKLNNAVLAVASDLQELKGMQARVLNFDGKNLTLELPELEIDEEGLRTIVLGALGSAVGAARADAMWQDIDGRKTILTSVGFDQFAQKSVYQFTEVRAENNPAVNGPMGVARFDVSWNYSAAAKGESAAIPPQKFAGFSVGDAKNIGLGQSAINRAPSGYFRKQPATEPSTVAAPIVIENQDTGETEVLNAKRPGSSEKLPRS